MGLYSAYLKFQNISPSLPPSPKTQESDKKSGTYKAHKIIKYATTIKLLLCPHIVLKILRTQ